MDYKLSIIIPVYQARATLSKTVESILNQPYRDYEIVLVDDGSTDGSSDVCDYYSNKYTNVSVVHTDNRGPYQARKQGVLICQAKAVTFIDSDDWIEENAYSELMEIFEMLDPDIIAFSYRVNMNGREYHNLYEDGLYTKEQILEDFVPYMMHDISIGERRLIPSACCKIFKKELLNKVFLQDRDRVTMGEDALIVYPYMCIARNVYVHNVPYLHYIVDDNDTSCCHAQTIEKVCEIKNFKCLMEKAMEIYGNGYDFTPQIDSYTRMLIRIFIEKYFELDYSSYMYTFPYKLVKPDSDIIIYGAGKVGKSYICQVMNNGYANVVGWYDKKVNNIDEFGGIPILPAGEIINGKADYYIIAIRNEQIAKDVKYNLVKNGINESSIVWREIHPIL